MATSEDAATSEQAVAERRMDFSYHELPYTITEGIVSTLPRVSSRVLFYPSLIYTMLMEKFSTREWFSRVNDHLIIGAIPFKSMAPFLVDKENLGAVVSVNEDFERWYTTPTSDEWAAHNVTLLHFNVGDYIHTPSVNELEQSVALIEETAEKGKTTYVHCKAGRTRSATVCAAYLIKRGMSLPDAEAKLAQVRHHIVLRDVHRRVLDEYAKTVNGVTTTSANDKQQTKTTAESSL